MPGITGIIKRNARAESNHFIEKMVECMMHEPFYTSGTYSSDSMDVSVGWVDESLFSDSRPVWNESRDLSLTFSGTHFSDQSVKQSRGGAGHNISTVDA